MQEDVLLVRRTLAGDMPAFDHLVRKHYKSIYAQVLRIVRNSADADELTNDTFVKAYLGLSALNEPTSFSAWLSQIARHHCRNWRQRHPEPHLPLEEIPNEAGTRYLGDSVEDGLLWQERVERVLEAIESLPDIDRALMEDFYLDDVPYRTLQKRYYLSKAAVNMRLFRAREKVRKKLKELFSGVALVSWRSIAKNFLMRGGLEAVKIGIGTKLVTIGTTALIFGGIGFLLSRQRELPEPAVTRVAQTAPVIDRSSSNKPLNKMSPEQDQGMDTQIEEATAEADSPKEDMEESEVEAILAFLDEMGSFESSEETDDREGERRILAYGMTRAELEAKAAVLEVEIYDALTECVSIYEEMVEVANESARPAAQSEEAAGRLAWLRSADAEWKRLFNNLARSWPPKLLTYSNYVVALGGDNPLARGGWVYELQGPLPRRVVSPY